jgi:hypothetical protein
MPWISPKMNLSRNMKTNPKTLAACAVLLLSVTLLVPIRQQTLAQVETESESANLNTVSFNLTSAQLDPLEGNNVIRAFVPTGSKSHDCLTSLNEIRTNAYPVGITTFCGEREPSGFGGAPGMLISIFFPQTPPADLSVGVTLYQKGAQHYGTPVLCTANDGC